MKIKADHHKLTDTAWLRKAEQLISNLDQEYCTAGKNKRPLIGLGATLTLVKSIDAVHHIVKQHRQRAIGLGHGAQFQSALEQALTVAKGTRGSPLLAFMPLCKAVESQISGRFEMT